MASLGENTPSQRPVALTKPCQFGRYSQVFRNAPQTPDCVVVDAARIEPVSTPKFPANREINREFCGFWRLAAILTPNRRAGSMVYNQIPYATEQGIFKRVSGKFFKEQGILTRDTSILNFEQPQPGHCRAVEDEAAHASRRC
jgi:hypothetical protein